MQPMWVVVADEGRARILERRKPGQDLEDIEELTDAAAHAKDADLRRDSYGRHGGDDLRMGGNAMASAGEMKIQQQADQFARRVADHLAQAQREQRYQKLRIVAAPKFLGRLRKALDQHVEAAVVDELNKDLVQLDRRSLTERLFPDDPPRQIGPDLR